MLFGLRQREFTPPVSKPFYAGDAVSVIAKTPSTIRTGPGRGWAQVFLIREGDRVVFYPETVRPDQYNRADIWMYCEANGKAGWFLRSEFEYSESPAPIVMPVTPQLSRWA